MSISISVYIYIYIYIYISLEIYVESQLSPLMMCVLEIKFRIGRKHIYPLTISPDQLGSTLSSNIMDL